MKKTKQVNLDQVIVNTVLALQDQSETGVPFSLILKGVGDLMGKDAPSTEDVFSKVDHLLGYDGMLHKADGGGYFAVELDAFACEVGIPAINYKLWASFEDEDLDQYVANGPLHAGETMDISELFEDEEGDEEGVLV